MLQVLALGLAGSLLGVALARAALLAVTRYAVSTSATGEPLTYGLTWPAVGQGVLIGLLVALLFSIVPLLRVRRVRPSLLLRQEGGGGGRDYLRVGVAALVGVALVAVAAWQAGSWRVGLIVCAGFVGIAGVLWGAGWLLVKLMRPLRQARWFALRHAALHLDRPGNQTRLVLLAVGLGLLLHRRRARGAVEPAGPVLVRPGRRHARHVPDRHPAGPGRRAHRVSGAARGRRRRATPASRAARARHRRARTRGEARQRRGGARPRVAGARVHHHLPRRARRPTSASSTGASGTPRRRRSRKCRSSRAFAIGSASRSATRCASTCWAGPSRPASPACGR